MNCTPCNCIWVMLKGRLVVEMTGDGKLSIHGFLGVLLNSQILLCSQIGPKNTYGKYKTKFFFEIISASWIYPQVESLLSLVT